MKGLLMKDFLTIRKKYGIPRVAMDIFIIVALMVVLKGTGAIYISFLLIPIEVMSMVMSLATCDQQWKWGKYAISLPITKAQLVKSRYTFSVILSCVGFIVALMVNTVSYFCFPKYDYGFYLFVAAASFAVTLLFLSFVLPSNYSLGENAGFAAMIILVILLIVLGIWSNMTGNAIMQFVVDNFEMSLMIFFSVTVIMWILSCTLSIRLFKRKYM
jgi:ABC-2 type transport system permease protein